MRLVTNGEGRLPLGIAMGEGSAIAPILADTQIGGFSVIQAEWCEAPLGKAIRRRIWAEAEGGRQIELIERFSPCSFGISWETELRTDSKLPFTAPIISEIRSAANEWPSYWAAWADPRPDGPDTIGDPWAVANADLEGVKNTMFSWQDPLVARSVEDRRFWYGAPYFEEGNPRIGFSPFMNDLVCMPLVTAMHEAEGLGLTLALSPEDPLLDVILDAAADGTYRFTRMFHRLEAGRPLVFTANLFCHEPDWRGSLRSMAEKYPRYFHPAIAAAQDIAGTGAYSAHEVAFDEDKLRRMAFKVNWKASFDFPYMGMFLPDVPDDEQWQSYGNEPTSIGQLRRYSADMRSRGLHVLSYFNVTEFGADVQFPLPEARQPEGSGNAAVASGSATSAGEDLDKWLWKDCSLFLKRELEEAILLDRQGEPYWTWGNAVAMDPGEPAYQQFLIEQAERHIERIPDSCGLCVDRLDWTRFYNDRGDDGISWFDGKPSRSLQLSWLQVSERLGAVLHAHGKVLYCNNHTKRLEQLLHVDGMFDEFTYASAALNMSGLLGVYKPVLGWVAHEGQVLPDYHDFFQRFLYMGVFPMAPFPGNDHSLLPSPEVDQAYLEYGPLLDCMKGKQWLLSRNPVQVLDGEALANVFEVPGGYAIPVIQASAAKLRLVLRLPALAIAEVKARCEVLHPGVDQALGLTGERGEGGVLELVVPVHHGCAMVMVKVG